MVKRFSSTRQTQQSQVLEKYQESTLNNDYFTGFFAENGDSMVLVSIRCEIVKARRVVDWRLGNQDYCCAHLIKLADIWQMSYAAHQTESITYMISRSLN